MTEQSGRGDRPGHLRGRPVSRRGSVDEDLDSTDFFCGMGGTSSGLREAGIFVKEAVNHWPVAIETHSANHPLTEHLCADLQAVDLRRLPRTRILAASPICTEVSPAGGRRRKGSQRDLFEDAGHVDSAGFERTRVTFWEVIRAAEIHRYDVVIVENVVEAADWELFDVWLAGMRALGYGGEFASVNSAHIGGPTNPYAPQWRDRIYGLFYRRGINMARLEPRPLAWCEKCGENVEAVQWWKPRRKRPSMRIGKYGQQYVYVCPVGDHGVVEPWTAPAAAAIDWTDLGTRIGDRKRPLGAATMRRIQKGLDMIASGQMAATAYADGPAGGGDGLLVAAAGQTWDAAASGRGGYLRAWPAGESPAPAMTTTAQLGLVSGAFISKHHGGLGYGRIEHMNKGADEPMAACVTTANMSLVTPGKLVMSVSHDAGRYFDAAARPLPTETIKQGEGLLLDRAFVATLRNHATAKPVTDPLATITGGGFHHSLVIPYRRGARPYPAAEGPLSTMATREQHGVLQSDVASIEDARFRMLRPREAANAQRFEREYVIRGNQGEQQMQAGNAVSVNVAHWVGAHVRDALDSRWAA